VWAQVQTVKTPVVHWAAHSLGGIVWLHLRNSGQPLPPGRAVLIGSPVNGATTAKRIYQFPLLRLFLGRSVEQGLLGGAPQGLGDTEVGLIRGGGWFSLSRLVIGSAAPSDGVVLHRETEIDGATAVTEVPRSHSMMIFSAQTAAKAANFFTSGHFEQTTVN